MDRGKDRIRQYQRLRLWVICLSMILLYVLVSPSSWAADFDVSSPTIELRRLQKCEHCGEELIVTTISPGAAVRCPKCHTVQKRLPDAQLVIKVYQVCPACGARLDVSGLNPNASFKCGSCNLEQRVDPQALYIPSIKPKNTAATQNAKPVLQPSTDRMPKPDKPVVSYPKTKVPGLNSGPDAVLPASSSASSPEKTKADLSVPKGYWQSAGEEVDLQSLGGSEDSLAVAVYVNGKALHESSVRQAMRRNLEVLHLNNGRIVRKDLQDIRSRILEGLIERELILQQATKEKVSPRREQVLAKVGESGGLLTYDAALEEVLIDAMRERYATPDKQIAEADALAFYNSHKDLFSGENRYKIRNLTIYTDRNGRSDPRGAKTIAEEVSHKLSYNVDFTALIKRYSEGPFRDEGGLLRGSEDDHIGAGELNPKLADRLVVLQPEMIAGPLELPGCLVFAKLEHIIPGKEVPYSQVKQEVRRRMRLSEDDQYFKRWIGSLRRAAVVEYPRHAGMESNAKTSK